MALFFVSLELKKHKMKINFLLVFITILLSASCKDSKKDLGDFINTNRQHQDSIYFENISSKSNAFFKSKILDSALYIDHEFFKEALKRNNRFYSGKASYNLASDFKHLNRLDSAFYYYNISRKFFEDLKDSNQVGRRLLSMAIIQKNQGDYYGAKETLTDALKNLKNTEDVRFIASSYNELGTCYKELRDYNNAQRSYESATKITNSDKDKITYQNNLALVHAELRDYDSAEKVLADLESMIADTVHNKSSARILHNLSYFKWRNGKTDFKSGVLKALEVRKKITDKRGLITSYLDLAEIEKEASPKRAKTYLDSSIFIAKEIGMPRREINSLELYMKLEPQNVAHKDRYIFLKDSLYQQELKVKTQFAKMKYDDEQEKARLLALEAETAQKEAQLAKEGAQRTVLLSLLALLVMGGGSYYYFLRQRHKKKTLQEIYNTEKKISKKIHDGLANDVYGVMTAVQHQNGTPNEMILDQLEDIYQRTRDISHDTRELATGEDFGIELRDMLQGFSGNGTKVLIKGMEGIPWEKLNEHKSVALHRTLKELLVNMKKHSGAGLVALNFATEKRRLKVDYSDNGIGVKKEQKQGVGLQNTENRIQSVGGKFIFGGTEGKGVKVTLTIPL